MLKDIFCPHKTLRDLPRCETDRKVLLFLSKEAFAKLAIAICEVPAKGRASIPTKPIVVTMGEERSKLYPSPPRAERGRQFCKSLQGPGSQKLV